MARILKNIGGLTFSKSASNLLLDWYEIGKLLDTDKEKIMKGGLIAHIKREISILRHVHNPNIVQLFEIMATKAKIYFVVEYVPDGELFKKVSKGRLKEEVARKYFQHLISAVGFCQASLCRLPRDLKPENLLLDENGDLNISDFGLNIGGTWRGFGWAKIRHQRRARAAGQGVRI